MCCIFDAMRRCFTKRMTRIFALVNSVWISDKVACSERERERVSLLIIQAQQQQAAAVSLLVVIIVTSVNACVDVQGPGYKCSCKFYALLIENDA